MRLAEKIKHLRREKKLGQIELAKAIGVSPDTYRRWEWGKQEPRLTQLITLAVAFNVDIKEMIDDGQSQDTGTNSRPAKD